MRARTSPAMAAATALLKLSKITQNDPGKPQTAASAIPETWRGWLLAAGSERGPHGERLFVEFLDELGQTVVDTIEQHLRSASSRNTPTALEPPEYGGGRVVLPAASLPGWAEVLVADSHVWHAPVYGSRRALANDQLGTLRQAARTHLAEYLLQHEKPYSGKVHPPHVVGLETIAAWLSAPHQRRDWEDLLYTPQHTSGELSEPLQLALAAAMDRYPSPARTPPKPILHFVAEAVTQRALVRHGLCPHHDCDQDSSPTPRCRCWNSFCGAYGISTRLPTSTNENSTRERAKGRVALQIALWQLAQGRIAVSPIPAIRLAAATQPSPLPVPTPTTGIADLGALIALHDRRHPTRTLLEADRPILSAAAAALDNIQDRGTLAVAANIAASLIAAAADQTALLNANQPLAHDVAYLARAAAGAFRELRRPYAVLSTLTALRYTFDDPTVELKMIEARQDLQLGLQRRHLWTLAERSFQRALGHLDFYFTESDYIDMHTDLIALQKRHEVTEQLLLGRIGGLVQRAEYLLHVGSYTEAARILAQTDLLTARLKTELDALYGLKARGAASPVTAYLRFNEHWQIMPSLMNYRIAVARMLIAVGAGEARSDVAKTRQASRHHYDGLMLLKDAFLSRHWWELHRIRTVAALGDDDIDFNQEFGSVLDAGGDDGTGDYVLPMLRWAQHQQAVRSRFGNDQNGTNELDSAVHQLQLLDDPWAPRLPDLRAPQLNAPIPLAP